MRLIDADHLKNKLGVWWDKQDEIFAEMIDECPTINPQECVGSTQKHVGNALDMRCDDLISRQAVLDIINFEDKWLLAAKGHNADTEIAFSGMKSKVSALPSVNPQEPKTDVLDKIRAEIEQMNNIDYVEPVTVEEVLQIIDKYKAESEDKE